ncbi:uncharacterized protein [Hyperolius riggenbachi]|uniref:uncharacterized protein n=1 Tax=Hyperolius riggenbachi TaxID=752182 RepID=UPI0035A34C6E
MDASYWATTGYTLGKGQFPSYSHTPRMDQEATQNKHGHGFLLMDDSCSAKSGHTTGKGQFPSYSHKPRMDQEATQNKHGHGSTRMDASHRAKSGYKAGKGQCPSSFHSPKIDQEATQNKHDHSMTMKPYMQTPFLHVPQANAVLQFHRSDHQRTITHDITVVESFLSGYERPVESKSYTMYHGTTYEAAVNIIKYGFKQSTQGMLGRGIYLSRDNQKAQKYPLHTPPDQIVLKVSVRVGKVKKISFKGHTLQYTWHDHGYDTAWVPRNCGMVASGMEEDCVWDPKRIKVLDVVYGTPLHQAKLDHLIRNCS